MFVRSHAHSYVHTGCQCSLQKFMRTKSKICSVFVARRIRHRALRTIRKFRVIVGCLLESWMIISSRET